MTGIQKVYDKLYSNTLPNDKYIVVFGNSEWGEQLDSKEELIAQWKHILQRAWSQDAYLYYNGKCIRAIHNMSAKLLGRLMVVGLCPSEIVHTVYYKKIA